MAVTDKQKSIFSVLNQGNGFVNPLSSGSTNVVSALTGSNAGVATLSAVTDTNVLATLNAAGLTTSFLSSFTTSNSNASSSVSTLVTYGDTSVNEFSQRMQVADRYTKVAQNYTDTDPECSAYNGVMGVVQSLGQAAMDTYHTAISAAQTAIDALNSAISSAESTISDLASEAFTAISSAMTSAETFISGVATMIADETEEIARQLKASTNAWLSGVLADWFSDTCKSDVTNAISTQTLKDTATS